MHAHNVRESKYVVFVYVCVDCFVPKKEKKEENNILYEEKVKCGSRCSLHETLEKFYIFFIIYPNRESRKFAFVFVGFGLQANCCWYFCSVHSINLFFCVFFVVFILREKPLTIQFYLEEHRE